jgi:DNA sulfur modification protein DndE
MQPIIRQIRISQQGKNSLVNLKKKTKIDTYNVLCRLALMVSFAEPISITPAPIPADSNLEISWDTLCGPYENVIAIATICRARKDKLPLDKETLAEQFRGHLHRGIGYLDGYPTKSIEDLIEKLKFLREN